eukprot:gene2969-3422_t
MTSNIYRSSCRRDALFKATDTDKKLSGQTANLITSTHVESLPLCARMCVQEEMKQCRSINYKKNPASKSDNNCQILNIDKNSTTAVLHQSAGWKHYEPVQQETPRCRLTKCNLGYECKETCLGDKGYECTGKRLQVYNRAGTFVRYREIRTTQAAHTASTMNSAPFNTVQVYCHLESDLVGWTLIARFSNADEIRWMTYNGTYWYDTLYDGATTSPSTNADMISRAFHNVKGDQLKITRSDDPNHNALLYTTKNCLGGQNFRTFITQFGDFRNGARWGHLNACKKQCKVKEYAANVNTGTSGFAQSACSSTIQNSTQVGFWCHYGLGDGAVIMIGGGGAECKRADHGLAITEQNTPRLGAPAADFGNDAEGSSSVQSSLYALNLWVN